MRCVRGGPESVPKETGWTVVFFYPHREHDEMCRGGPESVPKETEWTIVFFTPTGSMMRCVRDGPESDPKETEWTIVFFYPHRERDEMCERVAALTVQNQSLSQREEELYQQVKRSIALVEQAQLEQTEVGLKRCASQWLACLEACFNNFIDTEESLWCWVSVLYSKCFSSESSHLINFVSCSCTV